MKYASSSEKFGVPYMLVFRFIRGNSNDFKLQMILIKSVFTKPAFICSTSLLERLLLMLHEFSKSQVPKTSSFSGVVARVSRPWNF